MSKLKRREDCCCDNCYLQSLVERGMGTFAFSATYWAIWLMWLIDLDQRSIWANLAWAAATVIGAFIMLCIVGFVSALVSLIWIHRLTDESRYDPNAVDRAADFWMKVQKRFNIFTWPWGVAWILWLIWARSFSWSTVRA